VKPHLVVVEENAPRSNPPRPPNPPKDRDVCQHILHLRYVTVDFPPRKFSLRLNLKGRPLNNLTSKFFNRVCVIENRDVFPSRVVFQRSQGLVAHLFSLPTSAPFTRELSTGAFLRTCQTVLHCFHNPIHIMSQRKPRTNHIAGVSLQPEVMAYLDDLASRMRTNRSWVLNTVVHEYARFIEKKNLTPLASVVQSAGSKEVVIQL